MVWASLPCGSVVGYDPAPDETAEEGRAQLAQAVAGHADRCRTCFAAVSHPDFDLEWTA